MSGYIKIPNSFFGAAEFPDGPLCNRMCFVWLAGRSAARPVMCRDISIRRGAYLTRVSELADEWKLSTAYVWTLLDRWSDAGLVHVSSKRGFVLIGLEDFSFVEPDPENDPPGGMSAAAEWFAFSGHEPPDESNTRRWYIPTAVRRRVMERDGERCVYCGSEDGPFHIDHVKPRASGGTDTEDNLCVACASCNQSKGAKPLKEWRK